MSWFVPKVPTSSSAGADAAGFFSARPGTAKPSSNVPASPDAAAPPDFQAVLKAATQSVSTPAATPPESSPADSQKTPDQPTASKTQKQPDIKSSPSPQSVDDSDSSPADPQPAELPAAATAQPATDLLPDAPPSNTKVAKPSAPAPSVTLQPPITSDAPPPALQAVPPAASPVIPAAACNHARNNSHLPPPQPLTPFVTSSVIASSSPGSASPFLNAFTGIAEGLHKIESARQSPNAPSSAPAPAPANPLAPAAATNSTSTPAANAQVVADNNNPPPDAPAKPEERQKAEKLLAAHPGAAQNTSNDFSPTSSTGPTIPAGQAAAAAPADAWATPAIVGAPSQRPAPVSISSPLTIAPTAAAPDPESTSAQTARAAQESPAPDPQQTFDQVVLGLRGNFDPRNGTAEIQLNPPNLGALHVSVALQNGSLTAQFQSSSDMVRGLLKDNLDKLKSVLEGQGVTVDRLVVNAPNPSAPASGSSQQSGGQQPNFGSAAHDGRSAGQYLDQRPGQRRPDADSFARLFRQAAGSSQAPVDLVA